MIIIKTPQPPVDERLVLVPPDAAREYESQAGPRLALSGCVARDATPEDLERAGYVPREQAAPGTLAHLRADLRDMTARAEKAERERDALRAELASLKAPAEGEPSVFNMLTRIGRPSLLCNSDAALVAVWRDGVAHERARQQPAQDRATDEELERVYSNAYARAWESELSTPDRGERAGLRAVAARVRQERCLIARAVGMGADVHAIGRGAGEFQVTVAKGRHMHRAYVGAAEVPATLARLLGEVSR